MREINLTEGNDVTLNATLMRDGELFPVELSEEVHAEVVSRIGGRTSCGCEVTDVGMVLVDVPGSLLPGGYIVAVCGVLDGAKWRSACRGLLITKVTEGTSLTEKAESIVSDGDVYDITMEVQMYKADVPGAIAAHNQDKTAHADIRELIPTLPEHIVTDTDYVHTDNNYTMEDKEKLQNLPDADKLQSDLGKKANLNDMGWGKGTANGSVSQKGGENIASGICAVAEGQGTKSTAPAAHAEGNGTKATGEYSHAEGNLTQASGYVSHAEGHATKAVGYYSHSEGVTTEATSPGSHAEGWNTEASGTPSHAEGKETVASGDSSHAEGSLTQATGNYSHAEGNSTQATNAYAHAEGNKTIARGSASHAEGFTSETGGTATSNTKTSGTITTAGAYAHAEGNATIAKGLASHSEGKLTFASGEAAHAEGVGTEAKNEGEHAEGLYNRSTAGKTIHSVGIGTRSKRVNAFEITKDGSVFIYGLGGYDGTNPAVALALQSCVNRVAVKQETIADDEILLCKSNIIYEVSYDGVIMVELDTPIADIKNEYCLKFDVGSTVPTLTLPDDIVWSETLALEANTHFVILISYENGRFYGDWKSYPLT